MKYLYSLLCILIVSACAPISDPVAFKLAGHPCEAVGVRPDWRTAMGAALCNDPDGNPVAPAVVEGTSGADVAGAVLGAGAIAGGAVVLGQSLGDIGSDVLVDLPDLPGGFGQ